jgi:hypothetical protein
MAWGTSWKLGAVIKQISVKKLPAKSDRIRLPPVRAFALSATLKHPEKARANKTNAYLEINIAKH